MEEEPVNRGWLYKNRKIIGVIVLLVLIPEISIYAINLMLYNSSESHRFNGEFSHSLTIWVTPATNASDLRLDFYGSEQDASSDLNRYCGSIITITASAADGVTVYLDQIPKSLLSVWVKMYFGGSTEERTVTLQVEMGVRATAQLLGREISILLEPWQGEG